MRSRLVEETRYMWFKWVSLEYFWSLLRYRWLHFRYGLSYQSGCSHNLRSWVWINSSGAAKLSCRATHSYCTEIPAPSQCPDRLVSSHPWQQIGPGGGTRLKEAKHLTGNLQHPQLLLPLLRQIYPSHQAFPVFVMIASRWEGGIKAMWRE